MFKLMAWFSVLFTCLLSLFTQLSAQAISSDFFPSHYLQISQDYGNNWKSNSSFKPYQWDNINEIRPSDSSRFPLQWMVDDINSYGIQRIISSGIIKDKLQCNAWFGTLMQYSDGEGVKFQDGSTTLNSYFHFSYNNYFKAWLYPRITTDQYSIPHYTGKPRPNRRAGFNTGETDMAGVGYFGDWAQIWFGRGRQNLGAMALDNLALSEKSAAYDHGTLQLRFNNLQLRYFHGYLETLENNNNHRYITGRGIEYNNKHNLIIGAHEIVIYSGANRSFDIAYFNPIATHLEVELNQRDNRIGGTGGQNAVWQLSTDWMPLKGLRFSGNLLFDEFALDEEHISGTDTTESMNNYAYQTRLAYSNELLDCFTTFDLQYTFVSTYALRHEQGANNFISRGLPLGSNIGSDGDRWQFGIRVVTPFRIITNFQIGQKRSGVNNLVNNLYESYGEIETGPFPSGNVEATNFIKCDLSWSIKNNINLKVCAQKSESNLNGNQDYIILSLDAFLPTHFEL